eukprot:scaffold21290_cov156-Skeletonema_marinoi.AAC.7
MDSSMERTSVSSRGSHLCPSLLPTLAAAGWLFVVGSTLWPWRCHSAFDQDNSRPLHSQYRCVRLVIIVLLLIKTTADHCTRSIVVCG